MATAKSTEKPQGDRTPAFVLRPLLENIRLAETETENVSINCVEYWDDNLYIGTSASEILHFVSIPGSEDAPDSTFIEASRLQPAGHGNDTPSVVGVTKIVILPFASRACVLCNGTVSFYTLPELSPAPNGREVQGCQWIGGLDLNVHGSEDGYQDLMVASPRRLTIVRVSDKISGVKSIQFPGCLFSARRDTIACVADEEIYALLEIEHQQKIPLFPISSARAMVGDRGRNEEMPVSEFNPPKRNSSLVQSLAAEDRASSHSRSTSLGNFVSGLANRQPSPRANSFSRDRLASAEARSGTPSPRRDAGEEVARASTESAAPVVVLDPATMLKPHILSLSSSEFLLTTGTAQDDPGVGMFVNLDGDVVRGTIEFDKYPSSIAFSPDASLPSSGSDGVSGTLCALMQDDDEKERHLQVLSFDPVSDSMIKSSDWISVGQPGLHVDIQSTLSRISSRFKEVGDLLTLTQVPLDKPSPHQSSQSQEMKSKRVAEEKIFTQSFGKTESQVLVWVGNSLFCLNSNPLILQLEARIEPSIKTEYDNVLLKTFDDLREREAQTEIEFFTINYIRQKASLLMFGRLMSKTDRERTPATLKLTQDMLVESGLDPRIILSFLPMLMGEILQGPQGMWLPSGLVQTLEFLSQDVRHEEPSLPVWHMLRHFLTSWQGKRGFGSIPDEGYVFDSVDAALLHLLLHLEASLPAKEASASIRSKLNKVVDHWKGDFDRAVALLEEYRRLFMLSRLYQGRRLAKDVLATWKRVVDGEIDGAGELDPSSAQVQIRRYLVNIRDSALVQEYAIWLAQQDASLAVEVLTDDKSRVKFAPDDALNLLRSNAPGAVQEYLEHLVFNKGNMLYTDPLIGYYLDSVLSVLESSQTARDSLLQSYAAYRALEAPKPTYLNFIRDQAPSEPWWRSRLRLLQLLGGGSYTKSASSPELSYSIPTVIARLAPFSSHLVSESIILDARQGRHSEALRLLTHGLGDYDTAVRYCYFAGPQSWASGPLDESQLPSFEAQKELFNVLLDEFLVIDDLPMRLERSSELLAKFARWFDATHVLERVPDDWPVDTVSEFLLRTLRVLRTEMLQAGLVRALSAAENIKKQAELAEVCEKMGARIQTESLASDTGGVVA